MAARSMLRLASMAVLSLTGALMLLTGYLTFATPAAAQFWGGAAIPSAAAAGGRAAAPDPVSSAQFPQQQDPFGGFFQQQPFWQQRTPRPPRAQLGDYSKAPAPKKLDPPPTTTVVVLGDAMADWLGHGLEEAYGDSTEIGVVRKIKTNSGLIQDETRRDSTDWVQQARDLAGLGAARLRRLHDRVVGPHPDP